MISASPNIASGQHARSTKLKALMADCDMTGAELARRVDVFPSTVSAWVNARTDVPGAVLAYLTLLSKVRDTAK